MRAIAFVSRGLMKSEAKYPAHKLVPCAKVGSHS